MWFLQNVQIITPALIINKEDFNLSLQPNSGKSDPTAQLERERQTNVMKPGSWEEEKKKKKKALINGEKQLTLYFFFFNPTCPSPKSLNTRQKWKCNYLTPALLPCHSTCLGWWSHAWTLSPWIWVPLQPGWCHCLHSMCFPRQS